MIVSGGSNYLLNNIHNIQLFSLWDILLRAEGYVSW